MGRRGPGCTVSHPALPRVDCPVAGPFVAACRGHHRPSAAARRDEFRASQPEESAPASREIAISWYSLPSAPVGETNRHSDSRRVPLLTITFLLPALASAERAAGPGSSPTLRDPDSRAPTRAGTPAAPPAARITDITCLTPGPDGGGDFFRVKATVPPFQLATLETRNEATGEWSPADEEILAVDGKAQFDVWSANPARLYRVATRPFPVDEVFNASRRRTLNLLTHGIYGEAKVLGIVRSEKQFYHRKHIATLAYPVGSNVEQVQLRLYSHEAERLRVALQTHDTIPLLHHPDKIRQCLIRPQVTQAFGLKR